MKFFLSFTLLIFFISCDDNENTNNSNQSSKLLKSYKIIDTDCNEGSDAVFFYDTQGFLNQVQSISWLSSCDVQNWDWTYDDPDYYLITHSVSSINVYANFGVNNGGIFDEDFILNSDGTLISPSITFNNEYIIEHDDFLGDDWLFNWNNGNLIEVQINNQGTQIINSLITYEYTQYVNKTNLFHPLFEFVGEGTDVLFGILGIYGKNSDKLPSSIVDISYDDNGNLSHKISKNYSYTFDSDGYPTSITEIETMFNYDNQLLNWVVDNSRQTIVELEYY